MQGTWETQVLADTWDQSNSEPQLLCFGLLCSYEPDSYDPKPLISTSSTSELCELHGEGLKTMIPVVLVGLRKQMIKNFQKARNLGEKYKSFD